MFKLITSKLDKLYFLSCFAATDVFKLNKSAKHKNKDLLISASYFEIYGSKVSYTTFFVNFSLIDNNCLFLGLTFFSIYGQGI